jgi:two-component system alkaline phosphatase synthesis response regulator PhoP
MEQRPNILVVDDEPNLLVTYRLILQQQGYRVRLAISAEEARRLLAEDGIDLLLCDLSLEKQESGFDVIEYARKLKPRMPVVLLTGYATQDAIDRANERGIPVLFKPIDIKQLLQSISGWLRNHDEGRKTGS